MWNKNIGVGVKDQLACSALRAQIACASNAPPWRGIV